jgi:hypothetical protein
MIPSLFCSFKIGNPFVVELHLHSTSIFASIFVVKLNILRIFYFLSFAISDEKWANMPTCNLAKIVHNI